MAIVGLMAGSIIAVGLEEKNIEKLKDDMPFMQDLSKTIGVPYKLVIFYGETMADLEEKVREAVNADTVITDFRQEKKQ